MAEQPVVYAARESFQLQNKAMDLESGWLGRIFGSASNAPLNIAGLVALLLILPGIALLFVNGFMPASDYWKLIFPFLTLILGYLFGKQSGGG